MHWTDKYTMKDKYAKGSTVEIISTIERSPASSSADEQTINDQTFLAGNNSARSAENMSFEEETRPTQLPTTSTQAARVKCKWCPN